MTQKTRPVGTERPLRMAVIGAGGMGSNHVRVLSEMPAVDLVAVADVDRQVLARVTRGRTARPYTDFQEMLDREQIDAACVVVPSSLHHEVGTFLLSHGVHVLMEKPIAATSGGGRALTEMAIDKGLCFAVGHIERFNPAVLELQKQLHAGVLGSLYQVKARRTGPFPARIRDVGVVIDLATHDLDLMLLITGANITRVYAETERRIHTLHEDLLSALLRFDNGVIGHLDINWLSPVKTRDFAVVGARGTFMVNLLTRELFLFENGTANTDFNKDSRIVSITEGRMIQMVTSSAEPLRAELESFVTSVTTGESVKVDGYAGVRVLEVAEMILSLANASKFSADSARISSE